MRFVLCLVAALTLPVCIAVEEELYTYYLELVYNRTDTNEDGLIQCDEFENVLATLDLSCSNATMDGECFDAAYECAAADTGNDGVSQAELIDYISDPSKVSEAKKEAVILALTGVSTEMDGLDGIGEVNEAIESAVAALELHFTSSLNPDMMFPGDRKAVKHNIEDVLGLPRDADNLFVTFLAGSTVVTAKAFYPSTSDADAASTAAEMALADPQMASTALGIPVTDTPSVETGGISGRSPIAYYIIGAAGGGAVALLIIATLIAVGVARKTASATWAPTKRGCCHRGCCSPYALKGWSVNVCLGLLYLAAGIVLLYLAMDDTKAALICLIEGIYDLEEQDGIAAVTEATEMIPTDQLDRIRPHMHLLDLAVILPGVLAAVVLMIASLCACKTSGTMCCSKFFLGLGYILLLLCVAFYVIFAALAIVINLDIVQQQVKIFTSVCETSMPPLNQKLTDIRSVLARAEAQGMNVTEYESMIALYEPAAFTFNAMCSCIDELLSSFTSLFLPGMLTTCAIIYLYVATITMCCSAKCCAAPLVTGDGGSPVISKPSFHDVSDITSV